MRTLILPVSGLLVLLLQGCDSESSPNPSVPAVDDGRQAQLKQQEQPAQRPKAEPEAEELEEEPILTDSEVSESATKESAFDSRAWNSTIGLGGGAGGRWGGATAEEYDRIVEHAWTMARDVPLSTFAVDVDGGAWTNARRYLSGGALPPRDAVRVEEFVNWFRYRSPGDVAERGKHPLAIETGVAPCPWRPAHRLLRVAMRAPRLDNVELPPRNMVFLVDVSGSMNPKDKLPLLKRGLVLMTRTLRAQDRVGIVTYAGASNVVLDSTPGDRHEEIEAAIQSLGSGGSTHGSAGIRDAYSMVRKHADGEATNRVILATDGDFNVGVTSREALLDLIREERETGVFLSVLGFGTGNLKDGQLEALSRNGNGQYNYIDGIAEARRVLVEQVGATTAVVAKDVKVQIEFNPGFVAAYRQIGYENRKLAAKDFNDDKKDAGEIGAGHHVTALYEIVPVGQPLPTPPVDSLRYGEPGEGEPGRGDTKLGSSDSPRATELAHVKVRYKQPNGDVSARFDTVVGLEVGGASDDFRRASAAAAFGMLLRGSEHVGEFGFDDTLKLIDSIEDDFAQDDRAELSRLIRIARDLAGTEPRRR